MKKSLLLLLLVLAVCNFVEAKNSSAQKVFDSCGPLEKYSKYSWFKGLNSELKKVNISAVKDKEYNNISDSCYSKKLGIVIINVPLVTNGETYTEVIQQPSQN
jgi:hypothetical protein